MPEERAPTIVIQVDPARLVGGNLAIDAERTGAAYLQLLRTALEKEFGTGLGRPELNLSLGQPAMHRVDGTDPDGVLLLRSEAIAYGVRKASSYLVYWDASS